MTSQIISNSVIAPASLISFNLLNDKERNTLYLLGGAQTMALEVTNISEGNLTFGPSSQLILNFRPGTLINANNIKVAGSDLISANNIKVAGSDWSVEDKQDMVVSFALKPTTDVVLEPKEVLILNLTGVEGDNRAGSRPSQVELKIIGISSAGHGDVADYTWNTLNVLTAYPGATSLVDTAKETADEAKDFLGQLQSTYDARHAEINDKIKTVNTTNDQINDKIKTVDNIFHDAELEGNTEAAQPEGEELFKGITTAAKLIKKNSEAIETISEVVKPQFRVDILSGSNTILNDSQAENCLRLIILSDHLPSQDPLAQASQISPQDDFAEIDFDFTELGEVCEPTLEKLSVEATNEWAHKNNSSSGSIVTIQHPPIHEPKISLEVKLIFKITSAEAAKAGSGRLKISYRNLNGSQGEIYLLLYISALAIGANTIGIGTLPGTEKLKVKGDVAIDGPLTVAGTLSVTGPVTLTDPLTVTSHIFLGNAEGGSAKLLLTNWTKSHYIRAKSWWTEFVSHPDQGWKFISTDDDGIDDPTSTRMMLSVSGLHISVDTAIAGTLSTTGPNGHLTISGTSTLNGNTAIYGSLEVHGSLDVKGPMRRNGQSLSYAGNASDKDHVPVPWGTTDDWNVIVSPASIHCAEWSNNEFADDAIVRIDCDLLPLEGGHWDAWVVRATVWTKRAGEEHKTTGFDVNYLLIAQ